MDNYFHVNGKLLEEQYAAHLSDYTSWDQLLHAEDYIISRDIGTYLTIDETSLSRGGLYTIITNKAAQGKKRWSGGNDQRNR